MTEAQVSVVLAAVLGYLQQWLRGFPKYNDGMTLLASLVLSLLGAFWVNTNLSDARAVSWSVASLFLSILGGTALGTMAAHSGSPVMLAPKFNAFASGGTK